MTNLHEVNFGLNQYCGPSVLSALTGRSTDECAAVISAISGKKEIKAVEVQHLLRAIEKLGFDATAVDTSNTLYGTIMKLSFNDGFYIVGVPKHVVAIEVNHNEVYLVDNHSKTPLPANSSSRLMQKVDCAYKVTKKREPIMIASYIKITQESQRVNISRIVKYDILDASEIIIGYIKYKDKDELNSIMRELTERFN